MPETRKRMVLLSLLIGTLIGALLGLGQAESASVYQKRISTAIQVTRTIYGSAYFEEPVRKERTDENNP